MRHALQQRGLTLPELLSIIALIAIITTIAIPAWHEFVAKNRSYELMHSVETAVRQARTSAVTMRQKIELCGTLNGSDCNTDWSQGWLLRPLTQTNDAEPLWSELRQVNENKLQWAGFQKRIAFHSNGITTATNGRFFLCRKQKIDWQLILNRQGRLRRASEQENRAEDQRCLN